MKITAIAAAFFAAIASACVIEGASCPTETVTVHAHVKRADKIMCPGGMKPCMLPPDCLPDAPVITSIKNCCCPPAPTKTVTRDMCGCGPCGQKTVWVNAPGGTPHGFNVNRCQAIVIPTADI